ncbi:MAG: 50S ribosomal protein L28 [Lentisphaeria bacterium]|nr:50S ribosomal protein L28 [Lentisphaeria bacterium]NQZ69032.1 50S ribosomal protein L28 [Lentisphaeria bacterium]
MASCYVCGKGRIVGGNIVHRGISKKKGGIGLQLVKNTKRVFKANLQSMKIRDSGQVKRVKVCASCIRSNKIVKA